MTLNLEANQNTIVFPFRLTVMVPGQKDHRSQTKANCPAKGDKHQSIENNI